MPRRMQIYPLTAMAALSLFFTLLTFPYAGQAYQSPAYDRGMEQMHRGDYDAAITSFGEAICLAPNNIKAFLHRGCCFYQLNNTKDAISDFSYVIDRSPNEIEAFLYRGTAFSKLGRREQAVRDYLKAIKADPQLATNLNAVEMGAKIDPSTAIGAPSEKLGRNVRASRDKQPVVEMKQENKVAVANYEEAVRQFKDNSGESTDGQSASNEGERRSDGSGNDVKTVHEEIKQINAAIEQEPNNADSYFKRGTQYRKLGDLDRAVHDISYAIQLNPMVGRYYVTRARIYFKQNEKELAQEDLKAARNVDAKLRGVRINLDGED